MEVEWDIDGIWMVGPILYVVFLQIGYLSQAMAMWMGKTDDKPRYSGVSYFCWTDPTRLDLFICVAIFANDSGPASGT